MPTALELLREGRRDEIWEKYCGFIDLGLPAFMEIQKRLLMEQIDLLSKCELGQALLHGQVPRSVEEFQATVPLTTYEDYAPYLLEKNEEALPARPIWWLHTSGRSGEYEYKWVPYSEEMAKKLAEAAMAGMILTAARRRGEFVFEEKDVMLFGLAPYPYISGAIAQAMGREFNFSFVPPMEQAVTMPFEKRIQEGFRMALKTGMDLFDGLASVLAKIGDQFVEGSGQIKFSADLLHPKVLFRLLRGLVRSRLDRRSYLLPKDLWDVKAIGTGGTDTAVFRARIKEYWGREPVEAYACTEGGLISMQLWNCKGMTCFPDTCFLEFIPEEEHLKTKDDPAYRPRTVLLDQVEAGKRYEIVLTNLLGGAFVRYRVGDIVQITALEDAELGVHLPQLVFFARADDVIDIGSIARLTEQEIWQAIAGAQFAYADWVARKESRGDRVFLHLYIEPKEAVDAGEIRQRIHGNLKRQDPFYAELETLWNMDPLQVTLLSTGTFRRYYEARQKEGADLAHLKPPHMNPAEHAFELLQAASAEAPTG